MWLTVLLHRLCACRHATVFLWVEEEHCHRQLWSFRFAMAWADHRSHCWCPAVLQSYWKERLAKASLQTKKNRSCKHMHE